MAETYPSRTVSLVVPYPPGGSVDGVARILAQKLNETMGQNFVVDNKAGGAGGIVGANYVAKSAPDGYTLLLTASIHVVMLFLHKAVPYDVVTDFTPITLVASGPLIVSTAPNVPATTLKEFFELVRKDRANTPSQPRALARLAIWRLNCSSATQGLIPPYRLQGGGPGVDDPNGRPSATDGRSDVVVAAACQSRQDQGSGHHQPKAGGDRPGNSDGCRVRHEWL